MNKELILKYKDEFDYWLKGGKILMHYGKWVPVTLDAKWEFFMSDLEKIGSFGYVIDDKYVEFRKALAEGKIIQVWDVVKPHLTNYSLDKYDWRDFKSFTPSSSFTYTPDRYRIKPSFKIGDWVRMVDCTIVKNQKEIFCINFIDSKNNCFGINADIEYCNTNYLELWKPKPGEWVIPDTGIDNKTFVVMKYDGISLIADRCQPFIGELPK